MTQQHELPENLVIQHGSHDSYEEGACLLEVVAHLAGEKHSDHPKCACPVAAAFGRRLNDAIDDDATRTRLLVRFTLLLIGSRSTKAVEQRRSFVAIDFAVRELAPLWLEQLPELKEHAAKLRALPEIVDSKSAEAGFAVRDAARAAAWDARKARALLDTLDEHAGMAGMPRLAGEQGAASLEVFRASDWVALAKQANVRNPSRHVIGMVLRRVRARVRTRPAVPGQLLLPSAEA